MLFFANGEKQSVENFFKDKLVVLFGVPGAFTPVCSNKHVPSYVEKIDAIKKSGVDTVACVSVNDTFVRNAWADSIEKSSENITFIADWDASFSSSLGKSVDLSAARLGVRCSRFSMIVKNGVIVKENNEVSPGDFAVTGSDNILVKLNELQAKS